jgi:2-aminoadipate transaminase
MEPVAVGVDSDDEGMLIDDFAKQIGSGADKARLAYVLPNFQNPTGRTMSDARRQALVDKARNWTFPDRGQPLRRPLVRAGASLPWLHATPRA